MPGQHARLSASSAARWLNCPPSAMLAEQFPETTSKYAAAGTLAHKLAELKARKHFLEPMGTRAYNARLKKLKEDPAWDNGMDAATDVYMDELKRIAMLYDEPPFVALEVRVDYSHIAPEGYGTADCVMIADGNLHIVDYKNGAGVPVEAEENPQLKLYALGALKVYEPIFGDSINAVCMHIVQPNAGGVKQWGISARDLYAWGASVVKTAEEAYNGEGAFNPGPWCDDHFCPARATCTARAKKMLGFMGEMEAKPDPALIDDECIGDILTQAAGLQKWITALQDYAFNRALAGHEVRGFKLVEGRSSREWLDQDKAFEALLERGVPEALLWERKPVTVAGLEKALGKASFNADALDLIVKKPGKPALVPASDKRPAWVPAEAAFQAVEE